MFGVGLGPGALWVVGFVLFVCVLCGTQPARAAAGPFEPTWESLRKHKQLPDWLRDGKFGIYTHWGVYAVHAHGENTTWYAHRAYMDGNSEARAHFERTFGPLGQVGYKDLIPRFTAENFDAGEGPAEIGEASDIGFNEADVTYTGQDIRFTVKGDVLYATALDWPGEKLVIRALRKPWEREEREWGYDAPRYKAFYGGKEIKRITMLGDGVPLDYEWTGDGLVIDVPDRKPCEHAFVFKIERHHRPVLE